MTGTVKAITCVTKPVARTDKSEEAVTLTLGALGTRPLRDSDAWPQEVESQHVLWEWINLAS